MSCCKGWAFAYSDFCVAGVCRHRADGRVQYASFKFYDLGFKQKKYEADFSIVVPALGNFNKSVLLSNLKKQSGIRLRGICTATGMNAAETGKKGWEPIPVP